MHPEKRLIKVLVYKWANLCNPQELSQPTSFFQCSLEEIWSGFRTVPPEVFVPAMNWKQLPRDCPNRIRFVGFQSYPKRVGVDPYFISSEKDIPTDSLGYLEDHPKQKVVIVTMVIVRPLSRANVPLPNVRTSWLINGRWSYITTYPSPGMILRAS